MMYQLRGTTNIVSYEDHEVRKHENDVGWDIMIRMELLTPLDTYTKEHVMRRQDVIRLGFVRPLNAAEPLISFIEILNPVISLYQIREILNWVTLALPEQLRHMMMSLNYQEREPSVIWRRRFSEE